MTPGLRSAAARTSLALGALPVALCLACGGDHAGDGDSAVIADRRDSANATARVPVHVATIPGFQTPESVRYDPQHDVYFVSNIEGSPGEKDGKGSIVRVDPATHAITVFAQSGMNGVELNAPKGMTIVAGILWVADLDAVRGFNIASGQMVRNVDLSKQGAHFLNDITAGPDGALYVTDTGMQFGATGDMTHPGPTACSAWASTWRERSAARAGARGPQRHHLRPATQPLRDRAAHGERHCELAARRRGAGHDRHGSRAVRWRRGVGRWTAARVELADSSVYALRDSTMTKIVTGVESPADIGVDTKRHSSCSSPRSTGMWWMSGSSRARELGRCPSRWRTNWERVRPAGAGARELASAAEIRAEMEMLWDFHLARLRGGAPTERLTDRLIFTQRPPLRLERCLRCGTVSRNPRERSDVLMSLYATRRRPHRRCRRCSRRSTAHSAGRRGVSHASWGRAGTASRFGIYVGAFLAAARDAGLDFEGRDVNAHAVAFARQSGLRAEIGALPGRAGADVDASGPYHAVAIWNCFEQLAEPRATVCAARAALSPGGVLAIRVPNGGFYAAMRRRTSGRGVRAAAARALLAHNNLLGFPYRTGFTVDALGTLLQRAGFRVVRVVGDVLVPVADGWTRRWAAIEERLWKGALRRVVRDARHAPWFEVYARAEHLAG